MIGLCSSFQAVNQFKWACVYKVLYKQHRWLRLLLSCNKNKNHCTQNFMHQQLLNFVDNQQNNNFHNIRDLPLPVTYPCLKKNVN